MVNVVLGGCGHCWEKPPSHRTYLLASVVKAAISVGIGTLTNGIYNSDDLPRECGYLWYSPRSNMDI